MSAIFTDVFKPRRAAFLYSRLLRGFDYFNIDYRLLRGYSFPPRSVCLVLSEKCNLRCAMCDIGRRNAGAEASPLVQSLSEGQSVLSLDVWRELLGDLALFSPRPLVLLTGTEPLLYPGIISVIEAAAAFGLPVHITTNGTLLAGHAAAIAGSCTGPGSMTLTVSLDGVGALHDGIRGVPGTFDRAVAGIRALAEARLQRKNPFPCINITCTVSDRNCTELASFVDWIAGERLPVESITFNHLWFTDRSIAERHNSLVGARFPAAEENAGGVDRASIDMDAAFSQIQAAKKKYAGRGLRIFQNPGLTRTEALAYYREPCRPVFYRRCTAAWRNVTVTPRGDVILSPLCFFPPAGNITQERFHVLWNGERIRSLRRTIKKAGMFPACSRCCMLFGSKPKYFRLKEYLA